jgi:putative transcription factor
MQCEICGAYIYRGKKVKVEGSIITTCDKCAHYGEFVNEVKSYDLTPKIQEEIVPKKEEFEIESIEEELIENFPKIIREVREKKGMKQEDLARKINEPASLIHRIESGKFEPNENIAKKIEKVLQIKLLKNESETSRDSEIKTEGGFTSVEEELTLGDVVVVKKKKRKK